MSTIVMVVPGSPVYAVEAFWMPENAVVAVDTLNVRTQPSLASSVGGTLRRGTRIYIQGPDLDGWVEVTGTTADGTYVTGYVSSELIQIEEPGAHHQTETAFGTLRSYRLVNGDHSVNDANRSIHFEGEVVEGAEEYSSFGETLEFKDKLLVRISGNKGNWCEYEGLLEVSSVGARFIGQLVEDCGLVKDVIFMEDGSVRFTSSSSEAQHGCVYDYDGETLEFSRAAADPLPAPALVSSSDPGKWDLKYFHELKEDQAEVARLRTVLSESEFRRFDDIMQMQLPCTFASGNLLCTGWRKYEEPRAAVLIDGATGAPTVAVVLENKKVHLYGATSDVVPSELSAWLKDEVGDGFEIVSAPSSQSMPEKARGLEVVSTGTGFAVTLDGHIITNAHVVDQCVEVRASSLGSANLAVVSVDKANDLALLQTNEDISKQVVPFAAKSGALGQEVVALGYPLSSSLENGLNVTAGIISSLAGIGNDFRYIQFTAPVQPGNSGGPLLDADGNLVAVVSARLDDMASLAATGSLPQNVNFGIRSEFVRAFLLGNGVELTPVVSPGSPLSVQEIAAGARGAVMMISCLQ